MFMCGIAAPDVLTVPGDVHSLPMGHIVAMTVVLTATIIKGKIASWRGDLAGLVDDCAACQPKTFVAVPRGKERSDSNEVPLTPHPLFHAALLPAVRIRLRAFPRAPSLARLPSCASAHAPPNADAPSTLSASVHYSVLKRIHDKIQAKVDESPLKRKIFDAAYDVQKARGALNRNRLLDKLVFGKMQRLLGGKVEVFVSGAAPLPVYLAEFFSVVFGASFLEGYGLSETTGLIIGQSLVQANVTPGNVGGPLGSTVVRLEPSEEAGTEAVGDGRGEILLKGSTVFSEYWEAPEATANSFTSDGWYRTGDVGRWNADGSLSIVEYVPSIKLARAAPASRASEKPKKRVLLPSLPPTPSSRPVTVG